jgi:hypothetical protein
VVLVVVGEERQPIVAVLDPGLEDPQVPADHLLVAVRVEDHVGELVR